MADNKRDEKQEGAQAHRGWQGHSKEHSEAARKGHEKSDGQTQSKSSR